MTRLNFTNIAIFAKAERKLTLRLKRFWLFIFGAYFVALGLLFFKFVVHAFASSVSASASLLSPRFNVVDSGLYYLLIFLIGVIFLAFDVRARDERERMIDVLDAKRYSNLDLVFGRFLGLLTVCWVPVALLALVMQGLGWLLPQTGLPYGGTIEPVSLFSYPVFIALPAMAFITALIMLIALLVKLRVAAVVVSGACLFGLYAVSVGQLPYAWSSAFDMLGFFHINLASDWVPSVALDSAGWLQRVAMLVLTLGLLVIAGAVHPRLDANTRKGQFIAGAIILILGGSAITSVGVLREQPMAQLASWRAAHDAVAQQPVPDVLNMSGDVTLSPEKASFSAQLQLSLRNPHNSPLAQGIFSLNPGFTIQSVQQVYVGTESASKESVSTESASRESASTGSDNLDFSFTDGLLTIQFAQPLAANATTQIALSFDGAPNVAFGYLDSPVTPWQNSGSESSVAILGFDNAIYDPRYVALMPGIHWLPRAGSDTRQHQPGASDYFTLQLNVTTPSDWLVAGPGLRSSINANTDQAVFAFAPAVPVTHAALLAAPFTRYHQQISGIEFEVLMHPQHQQSIELMAAASDQISAFIEDKLSLASDAGLTYPFKAFTLVEVPNTLRSYEGGWQTPTALAQPGMVLMKESGLPTARFDFDATTEFGQGWPMMDEENGAAIVMLHRLVEFFRSDYTGGNVFTGIADGFFSQQTSAVGDGALALDYTLKQLTTMVLSEQQSYFAPKKALKVMESVANSTLNNSSNRGEALSQRINALFSDDAEVWNKLLQTPLAQLQPWQDPALTVDMLALKSGALADVIYHILGPQKSGLLIASILEQHRGSTYTKQDVIAAGAALDPEFPSIIEDWIDGTGLANFSSDNVQVYQLIGSNSGDNRFQLKLNIANDDAVTGFLKVAWVTGDSTGEKSNNQRKQEDNGELARTRSKIIRVQGHSAVEVGFVLSQQPTEVYIEPFLSQNRDELQVYKLEGGRLPVLDREPYSGTRLLTQTTPNAPENMAQVTQ